MKTDIILPKCYVLLKSMAYVAFFPDLAQCEKWLLSFRDKHDPKASLVEPHVTLVFPTSLSEDAIVAETKEVASKTTAFQATFKSAILMPESRSGHVMSYIFLVPDQGFGDIVRLHDKLYTGVLKTELRLDLPFIPHITIASDLRLDLAKALADDLNSQNFSIQVEVNRLEVVKIESAGRDRRRVARFDLRSTI